MASKITSASEVNTGFLSSVSIPNLRQGLLEHFFECSHESEDDSSDSDVCSSIFFGQIQSRRLVKHVVRGITQCSSNRSKTSARFSSGVPNTEKQMKARRRRRSAFIVSRCLEPLMKNEARVFELASQTSMRIFFEE